MKPWIKIIWEYTARYTSLKQTRKSIPYSVFPLPGCPENLTTNYQFGNDLEHISGTPCQYLHILHQWIWTNTIHSDTLWNATCKSTGWQKFSFNLDFICWNFKTKVVAIQYSKWNCKRLTIIDWHYYFSIFHLAQICSCCTCVERLPNNNRKSGHFFKFNQSGWQRGDDRNIESYKLTMF